MEEMKKYMSVIMQFYDGEIPIKSCQKLLIVSHLSECIEVLQGASQIIRNTFLHTQSLFYDDHPKYSKNKCNQIVRP